MHAADARCRACDGLRLIHAEKRRARGRGDALIVDGRGQQGVRTAERVHHSESAQRAQTHVSGDRPKRRWPFSDPLCYPVAVVLTFEWIPATDPPRSVGAQTTSPHGREKRDPTAHNEHTAQAYREQSAQLVLPRVLPLCLALCVRPRVALVLGPCLPRRAALPLDR